jgi:hypothetical protein
MRLEQRWAIWVGIAVLLIALGWWASRAPQNPDTSNAGVVAAVPTVAARVVDDAAAERPSDLLDASSSKPAPLTLVEGRVVVLPTWRPLQTALTLESSRLQRTTIVSDDAGVFSARFAPGEWRVVATDDFAASSNGPVLFVPEVETMKGASIGLVRVTWAETVTEVLRPEQTSVELGELVLERSEKRLEGTVTNRETGLGVPFAFVTDGHDLELAADERGAFSLWVKPLPHELRISAPGFHPYAVHVTEQTATLTIELAPVPADGGAREEYEGIGIRWNLLVDAGAAITVDAIHPTGPAAEAGVRAGDELLAVDGEPAIGVPWSALTPRMKGPAGTWTKLSLRRAGSIIDLNVQRRRVAW